MKAGGEGHPEQTPRQEEIVSQDIARFVRDKSREGQLAARDELLRRTTESLTLPAPPEDQVIAFESALRRALQGSEDLREAAGPGGLIYFFSSQYMTEAYANILLRKKESPLALMAGVVRENSALYPRPVALETFRRSPFDLTDDEIGTCLLQMAGNGEYADLRQTRTSIGKVYLFSSTHLEPDHAAMLAEWLDVGQFRCP